MTVFSDRRAAGTDPTDDNDRLIVLTFLPSGSNLEIAWKGVSGKTCATCRASNVTAAFPDLWTMIAQDMAGLAGTNTSVLASDGPVGFYRVMLEQ